MLIIFDSLYTICIQEWIKSWSNLTNVKDFGIFLNWQLFYSYAKFEIFKFYINFTWKCDIFVLFCLSNCNICNIFDKKSTLALIWNYSETVDHIVIQDWILALLLKCPLSLIRTLAFLWFEIFPIFYVLNTRRHSSISEHNSSVTISSFFDPFHYNRYIRRNKCHLAFQGKYKSKVLIIAIGKLFFHI